LERSVPGQAPVARPRGQSAAGCPARRPGLYSMASLA
jgi:hypothetical protein